MDLIGYLAVAAILFITTRILFRRRESSLVALELPKGPWRSSPLVPTRPLLGLVANLVEILDRHGIEYELTTEGVRVAPRNQNGFAVELIVRGTQAWIVWGKWWTDVPDDSASAALFLAGLCREYRVKIHCRGGVDYLWKAQYCDNDHWVDSLSGAFRWRCPLWKRKQVRYAQNDALSPQQLRNCVTRFGSELREIKMLAYAPLAYD